MTLIFGIWVGLDGGMPILSESRSKVKVKKVGKCDFLAWVTLGPGRARSCTIGSLPNFFGNMPKVIGQHGRPCGMVP